MKCLVAGFKQKHISFFTTKDLAYSPKHVLLPKYQAKQCFWSVFCLIIQWGWINIVLGMIIFIWVKKKYKQYMLLFSFICTCTSIVFFTYSFSRLGNIIKPNKCVVQSLELHEWWGWAGEPICLFYGFCMLANDSNISCKWQQYFGLTF